ncbi:MAG TPA: DUF2798 domain-containing protein [Candidatus Pseudomonas excrementavium]|uniref:DUF2798 domain-containing protein n=1 Tax=Halopseudomonas bauzanensis TaxID=653930 RepID=A0A031MHF7_9GAMM|nr:MULTISPECIES: DUF2798 domain-containing protein [Halopseudomonas]HIZ51137.1 DUF2798 domain-containing protein [Candidatus Pseudomonas excrementavium]EZQ18863.1 hypothetical protein CF98_18510 [Halopseudomonas bauzanensis]TKA92057.1 DUF2798 domain-containing protein [Halopseudomonas bauzanensis]WGK62308.1 DUF2798 domain-containing protein [Halopseudomonas sp. SMJS2]SES27286.1 Protein of unknown function [Halopseudomonas bauzanensis]
MINARYVPLVSSILMSIYMVSIMTFVITWANTGFTENFLSRWWRAAYIAWPIAFTLIIIGAPRISRFAISLQKK